MDQDELREALRQLYKLKDEQIRAKFARSLPFADAVLENRWERAKRLGFSEGASIYDSALVFGDVVVGPRTWIGPGVILDGSGGPLKIGANCSISAGVHIYTHDTVLWAVSNGEIARSTAPVTVSDHTYIGAQSVVVAGVSIGSRCIVGANSFVNCDIEDGSVVVGSPARKFGKVEGVGKAAHIVYPIQPSADDNPIIVLGI